MEVVEVCTICNKEIGDLDNMANIFERQIKTFINKSKIRNDDKWMQWDGKSSVKLHEDCRRRYSSLRSIPPSKRKERYERIINTDLNRSNSEDTPDLCNFPPEFSVRVDLYANEAFFEFDKNCFICGLPLDKKSNIVRKVKEEAYLQYYCNFRCKRDDDRDKMILERLKQRKIIGFVDCFYHEKCRKLFYNESVTPDTLKIPKNTVRSDTVRINLIVEQVCQYIENSGKFKFTIDEIDNITKFEVTRKTVFQRLENKYGREIEVKQAIGRKPIILYKYCDIPNICDKWHNGDGNISEWEKKIILNEAAEILKIDALSVKSNDKSYPTAENFLENINSDIPESILVFFNELLYGGETNDKSLAPRDTLINSILSMMRPKLFLSKLQLAVGVLIMRKTRSKSTVDFLNKLGVCASYNAIQLYESSTKLEPSKILFENNFMQYVFDNNDNND